MKFNNKEYDNWKSRIYASNQCLEIEKNGKTIFIYKSNNGNDYELIDNSKSNKEYLEFVLHIWSLFVKKYGNKSPRDFPIYEFQSDMINMLHAKIKHDDNY